MSHVKTKERLEFSCQKPRTARSPQKLGQGKAGFFPRAFRGSLALPILWFRISRLQSCKRTHFCGFKLPSLWYYMIAALANQQLQKLFSGPFELCTPEERLTCLTWPWLGGFFVRQGKGRAGGIHWLIQNQFALGKIDFLNRDLL